MLYKVVCFGINVPDKSSPNDEHFLYNVNIPLVIQKRSKAMKLEVQGKMAKRKTPKNTGTGLHLTFATLT